MLLFLHTVCERRASKNQLALVNFDKQRWLISYFCSIGEVEGEDFFFYSHVWLTSREKERDEEGERETDRER